MVRLVRALENGDTKRRHTRHVTLLLPSAIPAFLTRPPFLIQVDVSLSASLSAGWTEQPSATDYTVGLENYQGDM